MITDLFLGSSRRLHRDKEDNNGGAKKFILERSSFRSPLFYHPRLLLYVFLFLFPYIALVTGCSNKFARHLWRETRPRFAISKIGGEFSGGEKKKKNVHPANSNLAGEKRIIFADPGVETELSPSDVLTSFDSSYRVLISFIHRVSSYSRMRRGQDR